MPADGDSGPPSLRQLTLLFLKLGSVAFGGPASHIAMMEEEVVARRKWLSRQQFLDLIGATNLIPGPNSTEMAIHIGYIVRGWRGLLLAGVSFILPAALITVGYAWTYVTYGTLPQVKPWLIGIPPAVIAIIASAVFRLGRASINNRDLLILALAIVVAVQLGVGEIIALLVGGLVGMIWLRCADKLKSRSSLVILALIGALSTITVHGADGSSRAAASLWSLALYFIQIGSVLFGSGYVLFAFLEGGLVSHHGWISQQQLVDAVAAGQITPGPVLSTATFIGYIIHGWSGALVATVSIFLPSFIFVLLLNPVIPRIRESAWTAAFLDAVNACAIALMSTVAIELARTNLHTWQSWIIVLTALILAFKFKVNAIVLILGSATAGWLLN